MDGYDVEFWTLLNALLAFWLNRVLNVKALVDAFNKEKALVGTFSAQCEIFAKVG